MQQQAQQQGELVAAVETECADLRSALEVVRTAVAEQRTFGAAQPRFVAVIKCNAVFCTELRGAAIAQWLNMKSASMQPL